MLDQKTVGKQLNNQFRTDSGRITGQNAITGSIVVTDTSFLVQNAADFLYAIIVPFMEVMRKLAYWIFILQYDESIYRKSRSIMGRVKGWYVF